MSNNKRNNTYLDNMYQSLKRKGLAAQFEYAGVYGIWIDNRLVYIGKSQNMLMRMAQHYAAMSKRNEKKYQILDEARKRGCRIRFNVLHYARETEKAAIAEEIGQKEGEFIRKYLPPLNTWVPQAEDWHRNKRNPAIDTVTLEQIFAGR